MLSAMSKASQFLMEIMTADAKNIYIFQNIYGYRIFISNTIKEKFIVTFVPFYATGMAEALPVVNAPYQSLMTAADNSLRQFQHGKMLKAFEVFLIKMK